MRIVTLGYVLHYSKYLSEGYKINFNLFRIILRVLFIVLRHHYLTVIKTL